MSNEMKIAQAATVGQAHTTVTNISPSADMRTGLAPFLEYQAGTELFQQGFPVRDVYLVDRGLIKLIRLDEDGNELIVGLRSAGSILGAASAIVSKPHPVTAVTLTRSYLQCIPLRVFLDLARTSDKFGWHLHQLHSLEVYDQVGQLVSLKYLSARQRLEQLIWQLAQAEKLENHNNVVRLRLPMKYGEIAQLIGITPEHLSRVLRHLQDDGIILRSKDSLIVTDIRRLSRPADA